MRSNSALNASASSDLVVTMDAATGGEREEEAEAKVVSEEESVAGVKVKEEAEEVTRAKSVCPWRASIQAVRKRQQSSAPKRRAAVRS